MQPPGHWRLYNVETIEIVSFYVQITFVNLFSASTFMFGSALSRLGPEFKH